MATVNDNDPRVEYTATASQTTFTRPFFLNAEADLDVYANGVLVASGYTHTGVGANSGTIVFSSGRTAGDIIILHRTTAPERSSAYSDASPLPASSLEDDATRALLLQQEAARDIRRAIHAPVADTGLDLELPSAADRANKFPVFDADGNISTSSGTGADAGLRSDLASTDTGKGAALVGFLSESGTSAPNTVENKLREWVSIKDEGASGDGVTDDTAAINAAIESVYLRGGGTVIVPDSDSGEPYIFTAILVKSNVRLLGTGGVLKLKDGVCIDSGTSYYPISNLGQSNSVFESLIVDGNQSNNAAFTVADAITCVGEGSKVIRCQIFNAPDSGIMFSGAARGLCAMNEVDNCRDVGIYINGTSEASPTIGSAIVCANVVSRAHTGIALKRTASFVSVHANTIEETGNYITVEDFGTGTGGRPSDFSITANVCRAMAGTTAYPAASSRGISLNAPTNGNISDNQLYDVRGYGIFIDGAASCVVKGNIVRGDLLNIDGPNTSVFGHTGIVLTERSALSQYAINNIVSGNQVEDFSSSLIRLHKATSNVVIGNMAALGSANGIRVDTDSTKNLVAFNVIDGSSAPLSYTPPASGQNIVLHNVQPSAATDVEIAGFRRTTGTTPIGSFVPRSIGEMLYSTANGGTWWKATGLTNADWRQMNQWKSTAAITPPSLNDGDRATGTVAISAASLGDAVVLGYNQSLQGVLLYGYVSSSGTVTYVLQNNTGGVVNLSAGTLTVYVART